MIFAARKGRYKKPNEILGIFVMIEGFVTAWKVGGEVSSNANAVAPWWSITKTVIAVTCLKLCESGLLDMDEPLDGHPFNLRQLLQNSAGVPNYGPLKAYHEAVSAKEMAWPAEKLLSAVDADKLDFAPGTGWNYSNTGYLLVRLWLEQLTGKMFADIIQETVFDPLALTATSIAHTAEDLTDCLYLKGTGYDAGWVYHGLAIGPAADAVRFLDAVLRSDFLMPASKAALLDRVDLGGPLPGRPWRSCGYGLGLMGGNIANAGLAVGHSGAGPFSVSALYHFPDLPEPVTACAFYTGSDESKAEWEVLRLAQHCQ
jgi:CubicO group peptidase (beta-lactamase class C family)